MSVASWLSICIAYDLPSYGVNDMELINSMIFVPITRVGLSVDIDEAITY